MSRPLSSPSPWLAVLHILSGTANDLFKKVIAILEAGK